MTDKPVHPADSSFAGRLARTRLATRALAAFALLIVMACVGGFVLAAILLPLLELQSLVR